MAWFAARLCGERNKTIRASSEILLERLEPRQYMSAALETQHKFAAAAHHVAVLERSILHFQTMIRREIQHHPARAGNTRFQQHIEKQQLRFGKRVAREGGIYSPIAFADFLVAAGPTFVGSVSETLPPAPIGLTATVISATEIDLTWSAVADATGYLVERSTDGGSTWSVLASMPVEGGSATYSDTTASPGTTCRYLVFAIDPAGTSPASPAAAAMTPAAALVLSASTISATEIDVSWTPVASATSYELQGSLDGTIWATLASTNIPAFNDTGLNPGAHYAYRVFAINAAGTAAASAPVAASTFQASIDPSTPVTIQPVGSTSVNPPPQSVWSMTPNPKLPNVLILGDSISIGYTLDVRSLLAGKANVYRPLDAAGTDAENCGGTTFGLTQLDSWLSVAPKWDVIHFNFGLHDLEHVASPTVDTPSANLNDPVLTTPEQYRANLEAIVKRLKQTGAKLIFATTTPVPIGAMGRTPDEPAVYNAIALQIMQENGVAVDDLNSSITPYLAEDQQPASVHYDAAGYQVLAEQVGRSVEGEFART